MGEHDRRRWDRRHSSGKTTAGAPFGASHLPDDLSGHRCLDVAAGTGDVSLWAARRGMHVTAIDISPVGLGHLDDAVAAEGLDDQVSTIVHDLDEGLGVDLELDGPFDLVVCRWFRDPHLYPTLAALVAVGGWLSISVLSGGGSYSAADGELLQAFGDLGQVLDHRSDDDGQQVLARRTE